MDASLRDDITPTVRRRHAGEFRYAIAYGHDAFRIIHMDGRVVVETFDVACRHISQPEIRVTYQHRCTAFSAEMSMAFFCSLVYG